MRKSVFIGPIIAALALAGCAADAVVSPVPAAAGSAAMAPGARLVECPTSVASTSSALITPLGGVVSAGGSSIAIPPGAVLVPTTIRVTVPASKYMEVDISVPGVEHFVFEQPVTVTVGYARCTRNDIDKAPLTAWYIDSTTRALLEHMGGSDDKVARSVTFTTPHLSGYALAN